MPPTILSLPNELLFHVADHLSPSQLVRLFHVNRRFNLIFKDLFIDNLIAEDGPHGALFWSIALQDRALIEAVLSRCQGGTQLDISQVTIKPPFSVSGGDKRLVDFLLDINLAVEVVEVVEGKEERIAPLMWAVKNGRARLARTLISNGFQVNNYAWGYTPRLLTRPEPYKAIQNDALLEACKLGNESVVKVMLEPGTVTDIEIVGDHNLRPLQVAVFYDHENDHIDILKVLLEAGARPNACAHKFIDPASAIDMAIIGDKPKLWKLMLHYVDVEFYDRNRRSSALQLAARVGDLALVNHLIDKNIFIAARDVNGRTALHEAAKFGWSDICEVLLEEGADTEAYDNAGRTPLLDAATDGPETIKILVEYGAEVTVKDRRGRTPLHLAARNMHALEEDLDALVQGGAELDVKDCQGRSPRVDRQTMTSPRIRKPRVRV